MGKFVEVGRKDDLVNGTMKEVKIEGHDILLARIADKYYAVGNRCPHLGGNLSRGSLEGTVVTCPVHGSQFDITDGRIVRWLKKSGPLQTVSKLFKGPKPVASYEVRIDGEKILVEV
jgi:nitrite reductase/ring-hydroxylating ferredoxin subunit